MADAGTIRVVGKLNAVPLIRFGRNQRRAFLVAPRAGNPIGINRFRTWEEFASWQKRHRLGN
jgi:hypothetical protein